MQKDDNRRRDIVKGAFSFLRKNGLPMLSYDLIARECGVSRQLIRYYFEDPEELMVALCDYLASLYRDALVNGIAQTPDKDRLEFFLDFYFDLVEGSPKPRDDQVYDAVMSLAAGHDCVRSSLRDQYNLLGQVVSQEIQLSYPELSRADAVELSFLFVCLMYGHWKMVASLGLSEDHKYITRRACDRLILSYTRNHLTRKKDAKTWATASD